MDPCAASKVYWSVCIPSMLYGAEVLELSCGQQRKVDCSQADGKTSARSPRMYTRPSNSCTDGFVCLLSAS